MFSRGSLAKFWTTLTVIRTAPWYLARPDSLIGWELSSTVHDFGRLLRIFWAQIFLAPFSTNSGGSFQDKKPLGEERLFWMQTCQTHPSRHGKVAGIFQLLYLFAFSPVFLWILPISRTINSHQPIYLSISPSIQLSTYILPNLIHLRHLA